MGVLAWLGVRVDTGNGTSEPVTPRAGAVGPPPKSRSVVTHTVESPGTSPYLEEYLLLIWKIPTTSNHTRLL